MDLNKVNLEEFKDIAKFIIENNKNLTKNGKTPVAIAAESSAGVGKTSAMLQIANELGMDFVKISLSQLEEPSDLLGFPFKENELVNEKGETIWCVDKAIPYYLSSGFILTSKTRMSYAIPSWVPQLENENGGILLLDDYTRSNSVVLQSVMELINGGEYLSWNLPKNWTVVLTANPDDGLFNVSSIDSAQKTRYINFKVDFDINVWARWAEEEGLDSRSINFALYAPEIFEFENGVQKVNPRSYVTFCKVVSGINNWESPENLARILIVSKGCFESEKNEVGTLFTSFLANKLDKLITPEDMLFQSWDIVKDKIKNCVYSGTEYRPDVASILSTRLLNYTLTYLSKKGSKIDPVESRLLDFINSSEMLLSEDLLFHLIKQIVTKYSGRVNKLIMNPKIKTKLL